MADILINALMFVVQKIADIFYSLLSFAGLVPEEMGGLFDNVFNFLSSILVYLNLFIDLLLIPRPIFYAVFTYFLTIATVLIAIRLFLTIKNIWFLVKP